MQSGARPQFERSSGWAYPCNWSDSVSRPLLKGIQRNRQDLWIGVSRRVCVSV